jgi:maltooligosyltrehalose trehalohydrolase
LRTEGHHRLLWNFYQELLRLRRDLPVLACLDKDALEVLAFVDLKTILVRRWNASSHILAVLHFEDKPSELGLPVPAGCWKRKLDSADSQWGGGGSQSSDAFVSCGKVQISLSPWTVVLYAEALPDEK